MGLTEAVKTCFRKYVDFEGRASRSEFWYFRLFIVLVTVGLFILSIVAALTLGEQVGRPIGIILFIVLSLFGLGVLLPDLAAAVRRLHDTGRSGFWLLIAIIPGGGIVLLIFFCIGGHPGMNRYGPDPYGRHAGQGIARTFE